MSAEQRQHPQDSDSVCEFCGMPIEEDGQQCSALADGRCRP